MYIQDIDSNMLLKDTGELCKTFMTQKNCQGKEGTFGRWKIRKGGYVQTKG